jgi:pSer/pThr/pTyr-binding forkhead associated (FHA) protein
VEPLIVRVEDTENRSTVEYAFAQSPVRIGRSARNDLALPHGFVSASHGLVEFDGETRRYTDLGSTNGSVLDGEPLAPRVAVPLGPGAELVIGRLRLTFPSPEDSITASVPGSAPPEPEPPAAAPVSDVTPAPTETPEPEQAAPALEAEAPAEG